MSASRGRRPIRSTPASRCAPPGCCASSTTPACSPPPTSTSRARLAALIGEADEAVALAAALAVRAPAARPRLRRPGDDPRDGDGRRRRARRPAALPWPTVDGVARAASRRSEAGGGPTGPLQLVGSALYLDRYWREERQVAADLEALRGRRRRAVRRWTSLAAGLARLFAGEDPDARQTQAAAARRAAPPRGRRRRPGHRQDDDGRPHRRAAGRAGARRGRRTAAGRARRADRQGRGAARGGRPRRRRRGSTSTRRSAQRLLELEASTLHRLLGWRPGSHSRFRHDRGNRLPLRRRDRRRDLDGLAVADGAAHRGRAAGGAADPRRRPGPAHLDRGRRGARRHRRAGRRRLRGSRRGRARLAVEDGHRRRRSTALRPRTTSRSATASSCSARVHRFGGGIARARRRHPRGRRRRGHRAPSPTTASPGSTPTPATPPRATGSRSSAQRAVGTGRAVIEAARAGDAAARDPRARRLPRAVRPPPRRRTASRPGCRASRAGSPASCPASAPSSGTSAARCS